MKTHWVVVADEAIARILEKPRDGGDLTPVEELADPDAHAREADMHRAPHGRRSGGGTIGQATVSAGDSERHQHAQLFAARIAERLAECHREKRYDLLHILAAPRLLGYLRKALPPDVANAVASTQDKVVVQESLAQLTQRISTNLAAGLSDRAGSGAA
ncbi:MAG: host attachment protein [Rubrivivax sp.]|nr:MAG: host attachment protein [Rubrivivax sp.]